MSMSVDVRGELVHAASTSGGRPCAGTDARSRRRRRTGCCSARRTARGRRAQTSPRGPRRCRRSAASPYSSMPLPLALEPVVAPRSRRRRAAGSRPPIVPRGRRQAWNRPRAQHIAGSAPIGDGDRSQASAPGRACPRRTPREDVRLLLAALKLVNVVVLARKQPERHAVVVGFDRLGEVLPEVAHRQRRPAIGARQRTSGVARRPSSAERRSDRR